MHGAGAALDVARHAAGLALEVEAQRQGVEMAEHLERDAADRARAEIARRRAAWVQPAPRYTRGVLAKFAKNASSASLGAVLDGN